MIFNIIKNIPMKIFQDSIIDTDKPLYFIIEDINYKENISNNNKYAYRVMFTQKLVNKKGQADKVVEFIAIGSDLEQQINNEVEKVFIKETEKPKYKPTEIVNEVNKQYPKFTMRTHTKLWQSIGGKNPSKGFGAIVTGSWCWYNSWLEYVLEYCEKNKDVDLFDLD